MTTETGATGGTGSEDLTATGAESASKFREVVGLLDGWSPDPEDRGTEVSRQLRETLDRRLNDAESSRWDRDIVERRRGALTADVTVNGEIAVAVLGSARMAAVSSVRSRLDLLGGRYNYLVVYWRDAVAEDGDARRLIERRATARSLGVEDVSFVGPEPPGAAAGEGTGWPPSPATALVALVVPVGLLFAATGAARGFAVVGRFPPLARAFLAGVGLLFLLVLAFAALLVR